MRKFIYLLIAVLLAQLILNNYFKLKPVAKEQHASVNGRDLNQWYAGFNNEYFNGELPKNTKVIVKEIPDYEGNPVLGQTEEFGDLYVITINPKYNISGMTSVETLAHEACHAWIFNKTNGRTGDENHSAVWQGCMLHHFAETGAFANIW